MRGRPLAAVVACVLAAGLTAPAGRPVRRTSATSRAVTTYPSQSCVADSRAAAERMLKRLDGSFRSIVRPPFVIIGNLPPGRLRRQGEHNVVGAAGLLWESYFKQRPDGPIIVLLFADGKSYRHWAEKLFGDKRVPYYGYYKHKGRVLVMNIATGGGTLVHELVHALMACDFPSVPDWFNEGLASLHEQCRRGRNGLVGLVNWRLPTLQQAIRLKRLRPLRELLTRDDFYGPRQGVNYAQARYFVMYTQRRGLLRKFYRYYRDHSRGRDAAVKAVEHVYGRKLELVERDFIRWVRKLRWPVR